MFAIWYRGVGPYEKPGWCCWQSGNPAFPDFFHTADEARAFLDSLPIAPESFRASHFDVRPVPPADE